MKRIKQCDSLLAASEEITSLHFDQKHVSEECQKKPKARRRERYEQINEAPFGIAGMAQPLPTFKYARWKALTSVKILDY